VITVCEYCTVCVYSLHSTPLAWWSWWHTSTEHGRCRCCNTSNTIACHVSRLAQVYSLYYTRGWLFVMYVYTDTSLLSLSLLCLPWLFWLSLEQHYLLVLLVTSIICSHHRRSYSVTSQGTKLPRLRFNILSLCSSLCTEFPVQVYSLHAIFYPCMPIEYQYLCMQHHYPSCSSTIASGDYSRSCSRPSVQCMKRALQELSFSCTLWWPLHRHTQFFSQNAYYLSDRRALTDTPLTANPAVILLTSNL
jgi:hypothetical protein